MAYAKELDKEFQPTLPHRERLSVVMYKAKAGQISTHAPAQGATILG